MKGKLTDTNARISDGGRAERYWRGRAVKSKNSLPEQKNDTPNLHEILREYGLKGFEFGNWLTNNDRYDHVLACQKALQNLSWIMRTKNVGMNRSVGIAFGARGQTAALAHFEPSANMINLTKENGHGSLAHEYGHALDWNFGRYIDQNRQHNFLTGGQSEARRLPNNTGGQFRHYANAIVDTVKRSDSFRRIRTSSGYLHRRTEVFARAFEQYICHRITAVAAKTGATTRYLCQPWKTYVSDRHYLTEKDFKQVKPLFDKLTDEIGAYCNGRGRVSVMPYPVAKTATKTKTIKIATPKPSPKRAAARRK